MTDFEKLVFEMRQAQKEFFEATAKKQWTRRNEALERSKQLEKAVDVELEKLI